LLYMYPPLWMVGWLRAKVRAERPDCLWVLPVWPRWWVTALLELPVAGVWEIPHRRDVMHPGLLVRVVAARAPRSRMRVYYVLRPKGDRTAGSAGRERAGEGWGPNRGARCCVWA
jgi:hypothetical protein